MMDIILGRIDRHSQEKLEEEIAHSPPLTPHALQKPKKELRLSKPCDWVKLDCDIQPRCIKGLSLPEFYYHNPPRLTFDKSHNG